MGVIELLLVVLLVVILLGVIFWAATYFGLPQPLAVGLVIVLAIILLLALVGDSSIDIGNGR